MYFLPGKEAPTSSAARNYNEDGKINVVIEAIYQRLFVTLWSVAALFSSFYLTCYCTNENVVLALPSSFFLKLY